MGRFGFGAPAPGNDASRELIRDSARAIARTINDWVGSVSALSVVGGIVLVNGASGDIAG
jgi:hypothetical protein